MKIGILTHYYNSVNYGGNLQAYALCKVLEAMGHNAQQVQVDHSGQYRDLLQPKNKQAVKKAIKLAKKPFKAVACLLLPSYRRKRQTKKNDARQLQEAFFNFNRNLVPHGQEVYDCATVKKALAQYDMFITGSDQVWNPMWYYPPYFLTFAPAGVPKLSYGASIAQSALPDSVKALYRENLKDFIGVSVRESNAVELLRDVAPGQVRCVLDPTLLLTRQDWAQVMAPRQVETPYVFCYFLGDDLQSRQTAAAYAKKHGLTLVNIPNAAGQQHKNDDGFGDVQIESPSPEAFLSLVAHGEQVFTDSFHASVFSLIFQRQFVAFYRQGHEKMSARLYSLTELFGVPEHFCDTPEKATPAYTEALEAIDYDADFPKFREAREQSIAFLRDNFKKAEEMLQS